MDLELVTVGTELLLGFTLDTNAVDIARAVAGVGGRVVRRTTVADERDDIAAAVTAALQRTRFVVVTGGLGPTSDDMTKRVVAELFGMPLDLDSARLRALEERFSKHRRGPLPCSNVSQAEIPRGATVLENRRGTAPGLVLDGPAGVAVLLPGVPGEMRQIVEEHVLPLIRRHAAAAAGTLLVTRSLTLRTTGITESHLATMLQDVATQLEDVSLAFLPGYDGVDLRLTAWRVSPARADQVLEQASRLLTPILGDRCYGVGDTDLAAVVLDHLRASGQTLAVAESCTGGLVGARITAVAGASEVFLGGVTAYADDVKMGVLGVPKETIARHGAVSEEVAGEMARGVAKLLGSTAAIAVTGVAGPTGGTDEKPLGTVWIAVAGGDRERCVRLWLPGGRDEVRRRSTQAALDLLRTMLTSRKAAS